MDLAERVERFLNQPFTRRDVLRSGIFVTAVYGMKDYYQTKEDTASEYQITPQFVETLTALRNLQLELPQDSLYGFNFPKPADIPEKYLEVLQEPYSIGKEGNAKLIVVQQLPTLTITRFIRRILKLEIDDISNQAEAEVLMGSTPDEPTFLVLSPYFVVDPLPNRMIQLYHEWQHLFDPEAHPDLGQLQAELKPNIGDILLARELMTNPQYKTLVRLNSTLVAAYDKSLQEGNPQTYEQALSEILSHVG